MANIWADPSTGNIIVRVYAGINPVTGKPRQISKSVKAGASQDEIASVIADVELRAGFAKRMGSKYTVGGMVSYYLDSCLDYGKSPTTVDSYQSMTRRYIEPHIGSIAFDDATPSHFSELYRFLLREGSKEGKPLSPQTVKKLHAFLSGCFSTLIADGVVDRSPVAGVKVPRGSSPEAKPLSERDFATLIEHLSKELSRPVSELGHEQRALTAAIWLCLHTGVRRGELAGFRVIDFHTSNDGATVRVARSVAQTKQSGQSLVIKEPKSKTGKRTLALDAGTSAVLEEHVAMQESMLQSGGYTINDDTPLFAQSNGELFNPSEFTTCFREIKKKLKLSPHAHLHTLRHTHATYLLEQGTNIKTVQERLGHSKIDVTLGVYGHVLPGRDGKAASDFGDLSKNMMQKTCNKNSGSFAPKCPLSGETCVRFA